MASQNKLRSTSLWEAIFEAFGGQNGRKNSMCEPFFSMFFTNAFLHRFLLDFWSLETLKIAVSPRREHDFYKIDVFKKVFKKAPFWLHFWRPKRRKFDEKLYPKTCCFLTSIFVDFGLHFGWPKGTKLAVPLAPFSIFFPRQT